MLIENLTLTKPVCGTGTSYLIPLIYIFSIAAFSFGAKKKEKTHPPVSPEIWLQGGLVWSVKVG